jgi:hypothetical protein
MLLLRTIALVSITLLLGACAAPMRVSLTPEHRSKITELKAHVVVVQDEVIAAVQPSNVSVATGGGLIGAMIDSSITNKRVKESQQVLGPFYASIEDVDYRKEFNETIRRELANYPIKVAKVDTTPRSLTDAQLTQLRETLPPGQALLIIYPRYFLTMDFRSLDAEAVVSIWVKGGVENKPVQRGVLYYQSQPVGPGGKDSILQWGAQNAALFRSTLRESMGEMVRLIMLDMEVAAEPPTKPEELKTYAFNTGASQGEIKGKQLRETATRTLVFGADNKLYSLPKVTKTNAAAGL